MMGLRESKFDFMDSLADDWTGLWEVFWHLERVDPDASASERKDVTLRVVRDTLESGIAFAGEFFGAAPLKPWGLSVGATIERIDREWAELDREPSVGDIVWFGLTTGGEALLGGVSAARRNDPRTWPVDAKTSFLRRLADGPASLGDLASTMWEGFGTPPADPGDTLSSLARDLLVSGLVGVGDGGSDGGPMCFWPLSIGEAVERIAGMWGSLEAGGGTGVWFNPTHTGRTLLADA